MEDLEQYIRKYGDDIYRFCCNQTGGRYEAEELYQDTFLCVMENQKKFQKANNKKCYILGIALNLERNRRRKRVRRNRIMPTASPQVQTVDGEQADMLEFAAAPGRGTVQEIICRQIEQSMRAEIAMLPTRCQEVLALFYGNDLTVAEVAEILRIPEGTVKTRLYQARKHLKEKLEGEGYDGTEFG